VSRPVLLSVLSPSLSILSAIRLTSAALLSAALFFSGCTRDRKSTSQASIPGKPIEEGPITASKSSTPLLEIRATVRDDGVLLGINNIPSGSTIECLVGGKPISPCHDGALIERPAPGDYSLEVLAKSGTSVLAADSSIFTVLPNNSSTTVDQGTLATLPLALVLDDNDFVNGMPVDRSKSRTFKFKFVKAPDCKPVVRCGYELENPSMWPLCDTPDTKVIPAGRMAAGQQFLSVQASCPDQVGPVLKIFWYGVPADWEPLMLMRMEAEQDPSKRRTYVLWRNEDCPVSQLKFECSPPGATPTWTSCGDKGNVLDSPLPGSRIRATCGEKIGPAYVN
jgi:hypothetical protein